MEYTKIFIWEGVLINGNGGNGCHFVLLPPPTIRLHRVTSKNSDYVVIYLFTLFLILTNYTLIKNDNTSYAELSIMYANLCQANKLNKILK